MRKTILILFMFLCLSFLVLPSLVLAEEFHLIDYGKDVCLKEGNCDLDDVQGLLVGTVDKILAFVGSLALLMFVIGGVYWIISGGSSEKVEIGKKIMVGAVIGIAIVFGAFLMIKVLEDTLGVDNKFRPEGMKASENSTTGITK